VHDVACIERAARNSTRHTQDGRSAAAVGSLTSRSAYHQYPEAQITNPIGRKALSRRDDDSFCIMSSLDSQVCYIRFGLDVW
jgi:hypothetical protein